MRTSPASGAGPVCRSRDCELRSGGGFSLRRRSRRPSRPARGACLCCPQARDDMFMLSARSTLRNPELHLKPTRHRRPGRRGGEVSARIKAGPLRSRRRGAGEAWRGPAAVRQRPPDPRGPRGRVIWPAGESRRPRLSPAQGRRLTRPQAAIADSERLAGREAAGRVRHWGRSRRGCRRRRRRCSRPPAAAAAPA